MISNQLTDYIEQVEDNFSLIPEDRKKILESIKSWIEEHKKESEINLVFICTHNSRRSHIAQIWAQTAAYYYGVNNIFTYSGGTEATAFNPRAVKAMEQTGLAISKLDESENPRYEVQFSKEIEPMILFSKKYDAPENPGSNYLAIMTCDEANEACPVVFGADKKIALTYQDPKRYDGSEKEQRMYTERAFGIATEIFWLFSLLEEE